jgi:hypothetical protein
LRIAGLLTMACQVFFVTHFATRRRVSIRKAFTTEELISQNTVIFKY